MLTKPLRVGDTVFAASSRSWQSGFECVVTKIGRIYYTVAHENGTTYRFDFYGLEKSDFPFNLHHSKKEYFDHIDLMKNRNQLASELRNFNLDGLPIERIKEIREFLGLGE